MTDEEKAEILRAAEHWERLAKEAEEFAQWDRLHGLDISETGHSPGNYRARIYRNTAAALRLTAETGVIYCNCHRVKSDLCPVRNRTRRYDV